MQMQRLYSLQAMGGIARANALAAQMAAARPDSVEAFRSCARTLLVQEKRWLEASKILKDIKDKNPNTPVAKEADRRLREFPGVANVDKCSGARPMCRAIIIRGSIRSSAMAISGPALTSTTPAGYSRISG